MENYNLLNKVKPYYLNNKFPYNIINSDIIITKNKVNLIFVKDQNFYINKRNFQFQSDINEKKGGNIFEKRILIF